MNTYYDVAIVGSGFSGSLLAYVLASHGKRVILIDNRPHPRFSIGESSTPIADLLLEKLAADFSLAPLSSLARYGTWVREHPQLDCGKKRGFSYFRHRSGRTFQDDAEHSSSMLVTASVDDQRADTHWYRADVDHNFFRLAMDAGVTVVQQHLNHVSFASNRWKIQLDETRTADFLIDAGGRSGTLHRCLNIGDDTERLSTNTCSTYAHFENVGSWQQSLEQNGCDVGDYPFNSDDAAQHHLLDQGWLWMLRFRSGRTSVGWTRPCTTLPQTNSNHPLHPLGIANYPSLLALFESADRCAVTPSTAQRDRQFTESARLQKMANRIVGERFALMPTAAGVIDPLHSSGIAHGLSGVYRLACILLDRPKQSVSLAALHDYQSVVRSELRMMDQLVAGCYAAGGDFERFRLHSLFYFLAAIGCEESLVNDDTVPPLWSASDPQMIQATTQSTQKNEAITVARTTEIDEYRNWVIATLAPRDTAGLTNRRARNMYHYTAAPKP